MMLCYFHKSYSIIWRQTVNVEIGCCGNNHRDSSPTFDWTVRERENWKSGS